MGYIEHDSLVVVSWDEDLITEAHKRAPEPKTKVRACMANAYRSFVVLPHGSKLGWPLADTSREERNLFIEWMISCEYSDGSNALDWVHVTFGGGSEGPEILSHRYAHEGPERALKYKLGMEYSEELPQELIDRMMARVKHLEAISLSKLGRTKQIEYLIESSVDGAELGAVLNNKEKTSE